MTPASSADHGAAIRFTAPDTTLSDDLAATDTDGGAGHRHLEQAWTQLRALSADRHQAPGRPLLPGAVWMIGHQGRIRWRRAGGWARCYADRTGRWSDTGATAMETDTIFDVASLTKLFTSIVAMRLVENERIMLDRPVTEYLPEFVAPDTVPEDNTNPKDNTGARGKRCHKESVTVRQLLMHTSGFPSHLPLWRDHPDPDARLHAALVAPLSAVPGSTYCYSDLNLITLGELVRRVTGRRLDRLVAELITEPLGMVDTGYCPGPAAQPRIAATEDVWDPPRGMVCGQVHDENAWSMDGVAGHAGIFSTADDLSILAQTIINGGSYCGRRVLQIDTLRRMLANQTPDFPGGDHGLGFELNQPRYMGRLAGPHTCGHTGFTGTSMVIDLDRQMFVILLSNRVHPSREWGGINPARALAADAGAALADTH